MHEPLLDVKIPSQIAELIEHHRAGHASREKVIILEQAYDDAYNQLIIRLTCKMFVDNAGVRLITVEGANKELRTVPPHTDIEELIKNTTNDVSGGVLQLLNSDPASIDVWGVDNLDLIADSEMARLQVKKKIDNLKRGFDAIRQLLHVAQLKCYPPALAQLRNGLVLVDVYDKGLPINAQISLIKQMAILTGLDLRAFPMIMRLDRISQIENRINIERAKKQREEFPRRLSDRLESWYKIVGKVPGKETDQVNVAIDMAKVQPILDYWMEITGLTAKEIERMIELHGLENMLMNMRGSIYAWFLTKGQQYSFNEEFNADFHEEMMRLALRIEVPFFDLFDFRELVALSRMREEVNFRGVRDEIAVYCRSLVDRLHSPQSVRLYALEEQLHALYLALKLARGPREAEIVEIRSAKLIPLLKYLCEISEMSLPATAMDNLTEIDKALSSAYEFNQFSKQRSQQMARRTLELMRERGEDRAILVAGGFHTHTITRTLEDYRQVSWSVIRPKISKTYLDSIKQRQDMLGG